MKRKLLALLLALSVTCSLALPALAAQSTDQRLAAVTTQVKGTLDLDTEGYTDFYGEVSEELLAPTWYLEWMGEGGHLSISATEKGKILSYRMYSNSTPANTGRFAPTFPAGSRDSARTAALAFLDKVLEDGESVVLEDRGTDSLSTTTYRFGGEILLNGLSAGLTFSITLRCEDNAVTNFYRDDLNGQVMGSIPSNKPAVLTEQAKAALRSTLAMRLEYVLPENDSSQAILRYLPEYGDEYYVDGQTGELVNLSQLARELEKGMGSSAGGILGGVTNDTAAAAPEASAPSLSPAEQAGVDKLEGVLSRDALDAKARSITQLGLDSYTLSAVNYSVSREEDDDTVTAALIYGKQMEGRSWRRTVTLNARTGELMNLYSSASLPTEGVERPVDLAAAQKKAQAFLEQMCPGQFAKTELYNSYDALTSTRSVSHSFTFVQKANGYFFPTNSISVGVDATDGSISSFSMSFDDAITFQDPQGILTMDQALDAWLDTYTVELGYILVPTALDYSQPEYQPLMDYGISYLYRLVLGYGLEREDYLLGIDAMTGSPAVPSWLGQQEQTISYTDLSGHWAQDKVERLAKYQVGFFEDKFRPDAALTQLDLIALMASTQGYRYDPSQEGSADDLYQFAYNLGILTKQERSDSAVLTRSAAVKLILDAVGYGPVAQLEGIFTTKFSDDAAIPAAHYGYVALAQGLGMISGNPGGSFQPNAQATRAQAAVMLYLLMDR